MIKTDAFDLSFAKYFTSHFQPVVLSDGSCSSICRHCGGEYASHEGRRLACRARNRA